jgi:hypothetical protein
VLDSLHHSGSRAPVQGSVAGTQDRAAVVTTLILFIVSESLKDWAHGDTRTARPVRPEIEAVLRDAFANAVRRARGNERGLSAG